MTSLPLIMGPQGLVPISPTQLRQMLVQLVSSTNPDYTANLPSSLIEDVVSTDVGALVIANQFLVDLINSVSPYYANPFILKQLGVDIYGIQPQVATNTSVNVVFQGTPGFIIIPGFTISDGTYQYICTEGGIIGTNKQSLPINAVATIGGSWAVPSGAVNVLITSVPSNVELTVINPTEGTPATSSEDMTSFQQRVFTAGLAASTGMDRYLKTKLWNIPGVQNRLVSVRQNLSNSKYQIIVGGGDPYQVAWAIYYALFDVQSLDAPGIYIDSITNTNPIMVTTATNHNLVSGMIETISGCIGMYALNGNSYPVTVVSPMTFTIPVDGTNTVTYYPYSNGGVVNPNPILQKVYINSYPDTYLIPFILPAQQYVNIVVTWNTNAPNYVSDTAVAQAVQPAIMNYINNLPVGDTAINLLSLADEFIDALETPNILPTEYITVLDWAISFDGQQQFPEPGTQVIYGDPNSYFYTDVTQIIVVHQTL
jgi:Ubiquitin-activating enzyme E1 FCCH domain/Baseplate J-like protein